MDNASEMILRLKAVTFRYKQESVDISFDFVNALKCHHPALARMPLSGFKRITRQERSVPTVVAVPVRTILEALSELRG